MTQSMRATGTFDVKLNPVPLADDTADTHLAGRMAVDKQYRAISRAPRRARC